ncbi:hypothetical protein CPBF424_38640 [Xanthomonas euroxanthea]|uniref:Uncharacterized protein n=1 Tax=Xanthomonas euroxanthea TaxID=2259622 RepID=A0AA46HC53_9XANT|nr:hypothetical protein CPBF424_38640 [Xanthomonas euroxanthea]
MVCILGTMLAVGQDLISPGSDDVCVTYTVRHLLDCQNGKGTGEELCNAVDRAAIVLLAPLCFASTKNRDV